MFSLLLLAAPLTALLNGAVAGPQDTAGIAVVRGSVADAAGRGARDVAICIAGTGQCDVTGEDGRFSIPGVRAGSYPLEVIAPGAPPFLTEEVAVRAGLEAVVDVVLPEAAAISETVTVTAPAFTFPEE